MIALLFLTLGSIVILFIAGLVARFNVEGGLFIGFIGFFLVAGMLLVASDIFTGMPLPGSSATGGVVYKVVATGEDYTVLRPYYGDGETKLYKLKTALPSPAPACVVRIENGSDASLQAVSCPAPIKPATK